MKDLIILGNGMAGMTAALYAKRANLDFKLVGQDEFNFGQIGNAILVENFPCVESKSGFDLAMSLHDQLEANGIEVEEQEVTMVTNLPDGNFLIEYRGGTIEYARSVIYALGARHRELNCKIDDNIPIHYCALCDGALYKDKTVAVIGGGDAAFTQAEYLSKICTEVWVVMCDRNVTAAPSTFERVSKIDNIKIIYDYTIKKIKTTKKGYLLSCFEEDNEKLYTKYGLVVDGIFVAIGMIPNTQSKIATTKIITDTFGYIQTDENCATVINGFFAAGDVRAKAVRQGITAAADGAIAVQSAIDYLKKS